MMEIRKTSLAVEDLLNIWEYIASDSKRNASIFLKKLNEKMEMLADFPLAGKERDDLKDNLRQLSVKSYNIFYLAKKDEIIIVRVLHGSREIKNVL